MTRIVTVTLNPALDLSTETVDVVPDVKLRCGPPRADAGGGGVNVSRAIAFLGGTSLAAMALGGETGARVARLLREEGIAVHDLGVPVLTRENLSVTSQRTGAQFRFVMPGEVWTPEHMARTAEALCALIGPGDLVVPSGSLPPGVSAADLISITDSLTATGARIVLDTSGPALAAYAKGRTPGLEVLRMDLEEAETLSGRALPRISDVARFARALMQDGVAESVIIAKGAEGSVVVTAGGQGWHVRPPQVRVVSKVGAGDSFVAGFTLARSQGADVLDATVAGVGAAASAVTTPDTDLCDAMAAADYAKRAEVAAL